MLQNYSPFCRSTFVGDGVGKYSLLLPYCSLEWSVNTLGNCSPLTFFLNLNSIDCDVSNHSAIH